MTNRLELNWKLDGFVDEQRYYCSETPIDINSLPSPKATLLADAITHTDTDIDKDKIYYIRISSVRGNVEKFSDEITVSTQTAFNPTWSNVKALILADASSYPSSMIIDKTSTATINSSDRPTQVEKTDFNTGGAFLMNTNNMRLEISSAQYAFGLSDFVIECEILLSSAAATATFAQDLIVAGSIYGEPGRAVGFSVNAGRLIVSTRQSGSTGPNTNYRTDHDLIADKKHHLAIMRKSNIFYFFLDGNLAYTLTESIDLTLSYIRFMQYGGSNARYLNSIRVSLEAFYPEIGFTPPAKYPVS
ncbi:hypothetical protein [Acinetobacter indicus]|uniref:hypothetical protein n=1 Tax=Acinetobacter indicus TaxID=756892 RepID=UPI000948BCC0|nr:hypothetical protein [Acinetobacter indicus]